MIDENSMMLMLENGTIKVLIGNLSENYGTLPKIIQELKS